MALLIVIPTVWLVALGLAVVLCQAAARADAEQAGVPLAGAGIVAARLHEPRPHPVRERRFAGGRAHPSQTLQRHDAHRRVGV